MRFEYHFKYQLIAIIHEILFFFFYAAGPTSGGVVTLKTGRREVPASNPDRTCRPSRSKFRGFLRNSRKYRLESLRMTPTEGTSPVDERSHKRTIVLQPTASQLTFTY